MDSNPIEEMNKKEILEKLKSLCASDDIEAVNQEVNDLSDAFLRAKEDDDKKKETEKGEEDKEEITAVASDELDEDHEAFKIILKAFTEKKSAFFKRRKEEEEKNYEQKKSLLNKLKTIISDEENIGKAFAKVNEIKEKWNEVGSIGRMREHEVQQDYSKLMEEFYYNISIYKEIKDHDLKRNFQLKQDVIQKLEELMKEENIKTVEASIRLLQNDWENIGGTYQEKWEELKDKYWNTIRSLYDKIRDHYEGRRRIMSQNLELKKDLFAKATTLVEEMPDDHKSWDKKTADIKLIQDEWKKIGIAPRKENNELWKSFRGLCDQFFDAKKEFYEQRHEEFSDVKSAKEHLIEKVEALKGSSDWKNTANQIIKIQKDWKKLGTAGPRYEQKLWSSFRGACDHFFTRRDEHFAKLTVEEDENLKKKRNYIEELKNLELPKQAQEALKILENTAKEFQSIGKVPFKESKNIYQQFKDTLQVHYEKLDLKPEEKEKQLFKTKVETMKSAPDAGKKIGQEKDKIRRQIKTLHDEITQYENNLGFFSNSKGADALKKQVEQNIEERKDKIQSLKQKLSLLN